MDWSFRLHRVGAQGVSAADNRSSGSVTTASAATAPANDGPGGGGGDGDGTIARPTGSSSRNKVFYNRDLCGIISAYINVIKVVGNEGRLPIHIAAQGSSVEFPVVGTTASAILTSTSSSSSFLYVISAVTVLIISSLVARRSSLFVFLTISRSTIDFREKYSIDVWFPSKFPYEKDDHFCT